MKKLIALIVAALMLVGMLAGCGAKEAPAVDVPATDAPAAPASSNEAKPAEDIVISIGVKESDNVTAELWKTIFDAFEADNPGIKVEKVLATGDSDMAFWKTQKASGNFPDIIFNATALASIEGLFAEIPEDVKALFEEGTLTTNYGKYVSIPHSKQLRMQCYYNKADFAQLGLSEPTTYAEFLDVCQKLKDAGKVPLICGGTGDNWATGEPWWISVVNSTINEAYPDFNKKLLAGEVRWDDPVIVDALTQWQDDLINKGYYFEGSMSYSYAQAAAEFQSGAASMMVDGSWAAAGFDAAGNTDFGVFMVPHPDGLKTYAAKVTTMGVHAESKNLDAAWQFVRWFFNNPEIYSAYLKADGLMSVTKEAVTYEQGPLMNKLVADLADWTVVTEVLVAKGEYAPPAGMEDECCKILQNVFIGKDAATELEALQVQFEMISQ